MTSYTDRNEISKNRLNSFSDLFPLPSAIFRQTDVTALRIWLVKPYNSSFGNRLLILYIATVNSIAR